MSDDHKSQDECVSDDHKSQDDCVCNRRTEGRSEGRREARAGGVGRDGSQNTRTPHRDVGNKTLPIFLAHKHLCHVH